MNHAQSTPRLLPLIVLIAAILALVAGFALQGDPGQSSAKAPTTNPFHSTNPYHGTNSATNPYHSTNPFHSTN